MNRELVDILARQLLSIREQVDAALIAVGTLQGEITKEVEDIELPDLPKVFSRGSSEKE